MMPGLRYQSRSSPLPTFRLVPNQQSFGHMSRWLAKDKYRPLAECPEGFPHPFARHPEPFTLCPTDPKAFELVAGLHTELAAHFSDSCVPPWPGAMSLSPARLHRSSRLRLDFREINVGLDETFDLGKGRSGAECRRDGLGRVYLRYLLRVHKHVSSLGRRMQYWGDIVLHHQELIPELPRVRGHDPPAFEPVAGRSPDCVVLWYRMPRH